MPTTARWPPGGQALARVIGVQRFEQQFSMGDGPFDLGQLRRAVQEALDHLALGHGRTAGCTALVEVQDVARETRVRMCSAALRCSQPSTRMVNGPAGAAESTWQGQ